MFTKKNIFLALFLLAACGTLPQPFYGNPGPEAEKLAIPPAPVLIILPAAGPAGAPYAQDMAAALAALDVPSIAGPADPAQWQLTTAPQPAGATIIPAYKIIGPDKKTYGTQYGTPIPAAAWNAADPATLTAAATTDSLSLSKLLASINAQVQQANPDSLENRPPRIFMGTVTGAPGDGDTVLPLNMSRDLAGPNDEVVTTEASADFVVTGNVIASPFKDGQIMVELDWTITDTSHRKVGQVTQLHPLNPADITPYWGDVAAAAAAEAAAGVQNVITNDTLHKPATP